MPGRILTSFSVAWSGRCRVARLSEQRDSHWYLREARLARYKADATSDPVLRDSYLQVAEAYEKLAETLERPPTPAR